MSSSIRKFLLFYLLLAITITTSLTAVGNYYLDQKDIQAHLDTLMAVSALSYQALLGDDVHQRPLTKIQEALDKIPHTIEKYYEGQFLNEQSDTNFLNKFNFQVWTNGGRLLLHSATAPKIPLISEVDGFNDKEVDNQQWRVFTTYNNKAGTRTVLAERYDTRNELGHRIAQDDLYIMLLTFPLSGLLIWIIIGHGLNSLEKVAEEVSSRAPTHLEPVDLKEVPQEVKPLIDELNKLFNRLKAGFEREKRFAADAAHELRTPLAAIKAQAQVALNSSSMQAKDEALQKLITSVNRGSHVVQQLLTMSRLVPEAEEINDIAEVNLVKLCRETLALLAPTAVEKSIDLSFEPSNNNLKLRGNTTALGILVRNLVDNAIRYSEAEGQVIVRLYQTAQDMVLEVQDTGPGIPEDLKARVFERFFRVIGSRSTGSGLGLAIVQQICELHKGRVELDSPKNGKGLILRVLFPQSA